jgi:hypothetical protein
VAVIKKEVETLRQQIKDGTYKGSDDPESKEIIADILAQEQLDDPHGDPLGPNFIERMEKALAGPRYGIPNGLSAEEIGQWITKVSEGDPETVAKALELAKQNEEPKPDKQRSPVVDSKRKAFFSTKKRRR